MLNQQIIYCLHAHFRIILGKIVMVGFYDSIKLNKFLDIQFAL